MSIKNVFDDIASFSGLYQANHDISAGNREGKTELEFWNDEEIYLHDLSKGLYRGVYPEDRYLTFFVYEPKLRKIVCSDYITKLIHRSAYNVLNPLICNTFISDTYACIKGRGTLNAVKRLRSWLDYVSKDKHPWYYLKMDAEKFFYRINHEILMKLLFKKISDVRTLDLLHHYICEASKPFGLPIGVKNPMLVSDDEMLWEVGITIGGGLSHAHGNIYLDPLDQFIKRKLRMKFYVRFMDDVIILSDSKSKLQNCLHDVSAFLSDELDLRLNNKTAIRPITQGIEFVGYRIWSGRTELRKSTTLRMKRHLKNKIELYRRNEISFQKAWETVMSYKAMLDTCDGTALKNKVLGDVCLTHATREEVEAEEEMFGTRGYEYLDC